MDLVEKYLRHTNKLTLANWIWVMRVYRDIIRTSLAFRVTVSLDCSKSILILNRRKLSSVQQIFSNTIFVAFLSQL